ncbi:outer membrane beta-barrel protein [Dyadobacter subterraneus]|uniref:TonB-dependent receptor n=1 Tax=Dyadobacter subterraneus TaxID=2773304 RepID=A0ABR9WHH9_9BACT|nr:outer membrane beta-barrel protein [Dyadobacter subterraneus]MBE9464356.1 TonB-dependent receptor [Dyadobacter subterraneus]
MKTIFASVLLILCMALPGFVHAQTAQITGTVLDSTSRSPVVGAYVAVSRNVPDAKPEYVTTDVNGKFLVTGLNKESYRVKISYLSYKDAERVITMSDDIQNAGTFLLSEAVSNLKEVKVVGQVAAAEQKGDTTQFNAAAYKTNPDATTEDLIQKMPGITVTNGTVTAHGETVNKVLVDGKPFFGDDAALTLKSLPAEIVDKIEVFDKLSDQSAFTGFDDGTGQKTINIVTKANRRVGQFGKVYAGYGTDDRYQAGGNMSFFNKNQRISVIGLTNNINVQNFSNQDLLGVSGGGGGGGGGGRGGAGGAGGASSNFLVGNQSGLTGTNSFGLNYSNKFGNKVDVTGSYFFNRTSNNNFQNTNQDYYGKQLYKESNTSGSTNINHRLNFRVEYTIDKKNMLIFTPRLSFQNNQSGIVKDGFTTLGDGTAVNSTATDQSNKNHGYNFTNDLLFRHAFDKKGRTLSFNLNTQINDKSGNGQLYSKNQYFTNLEMPGDTIDQKNYTSSNALSLGGNLVYTEPISSTGQLQFNYGLTVSNSNSDKETYNNVLPDGSSYTQLDSLLSNSFDNRYTTNRAGIGYRYRKNNWSGNVGVDFQNTGLYSKQLSPINEKVDHTFTNFLPNLMLTYRSKSGTQFRTFFRSSTNQPSISQLQNVVDNSNPLSLTAGNPNLKQEYRNTLNMRYSIAGANHPYNLNAMIFVTQTNNAIVNSTFIAQQPTTLPSGIVLEQGAKLTAPINMDGSWNARTLIAYGKPISKIKLNVNLTSGFNYVRAPGMINNISNFSNTYAYSQGLVLSSNISEKLDFTASYSGNYNVVRNSIQPTLNNNYFTSSITGRVNWIFGKGFLLQSDINNQSYRGLGAGYNQNFTLWNASFGKKFLKNNAGELKLTVFDILKQNNSITRNVTETYVQDVTSRVLTQYAMLTFTYTLRNFGKMPTNNNSERRRDFDGMGGGFPGGGRPGGGPGSF